MALLMGDALSVSAGVVDLVTEVPRPENRYIYLLKGKFVLTPCLQLLRSNATSVV